MSDIHSMVIACSSHVRRMFVACSSTRHVNSSVRYRCASWILNEYILGVFIGVSWPRMSMNTGHLKIEAGIPSIYCMHTAFTYMRSVTFPFRQTLCFQLAWSFMICLQPGLHEGSISIRCSSVLIWSIIGRLLGGLLSASDHRVFTAT